MGSEVRQYGLDHLWGLSTLQGGKRAPTLSSPASEAPYLSWWISWSVKEVARVREVVIFHSSLPGLQVLSHFLFSLFPSSYPVKWGIFLAALVVWDLLQAFSRYSVRTVPYVEIFLTYLWEEVNSMSFYFTILNQNSMFNLLRNCQGVFQSACTITTSSVQGFQFLHILGNIYQHSVQFNCTIVSDSFATHWTAEHQVSLSITNSWNFLKLMSIESVMPSNHLVLCRPLLLLLSIFPSIRVLSKDSALQIR